MVNLHWRNIILNVSCALCNVHPEDSLHAVWSCEVISGVWSTLEWFHQAVPAQPSSFSDLLSRFLFCREEFRAETFVTIAWFLWNRRNAIHFSRPALPVHNICSKARSYLREFLQAQTEEPAPPYPPLMQQWCPPEPHCYKVNFNAVVFRVSRLVGISVIVHNDGGETMGALSSSIPMAQSVADLKALACLKVVQFALELGLTRVVFEGDSIVIINALPHGVGDMASFGNILDNIRMHSAVFQFVEFVYVNRSCNTVANALAKKAKSDVGVHVWLNDLPADIASLVLRDVH